MKDIKVTKRLLVCALILFFITEGCNDFLSKEDPSHFTSKTYYKNASDARRAVNAIYASIYPIYGNEDWMITLFRTGIVNTNFAGNGGYPHFQQVKNLGDFSDIQALKELWNSYYRGISNANLAIAKIPKIQMNNTEKNRLLGQARFLRAYYYFNLVRMFGKVPLLEKKVGLNSPELNPKRASIEAIYNLIVKDLTTAESSGLPFNSQTGKVTEGAVKSLLSSIYLTMAGYPLQGGTKYYKLARDEAKEIIDSQEYSLFSSYDFLRNESDNNTGEYIYEIQFNKDDHPHDALQIGIIPFKLNISVYAGEEGFAFIPRQFVNSFEAGDKRAKERNFFFTEYTSQDNRSDTVHFSDSYIYKFFNSDAHLNTAKSGLNWPVIRYPEVLLNYAEASNEISGPTPRAYKAVNKIRKRAEIPNLSGLTRVEFRKAIWKERYHELCFENKIWFDMVRTRKAFNLSTEGFEDYVGHTFVYGKTLKKRDLLFPLPADEIKNNKNLKQNPGY